jgi:hypothetical protein
MLDLMSATEAALRNDFDQRVDRKKKDPLSRRFRQLRKKHGDRVRLDEHLLEAWSLSVEDADDLHRRTVREAIALFRGDINLRNWLAHGRHRRPKLARQYPSAAEVFEACRRLQIATGLREETGH